VWLALAFLCWCAVRVWRDRATTAGEWLEEVSARAPLTG